MPQMHDSQNPDDTKLKELILFICRESEGDERFGATKLNKLLFYADFLYYMRTGNSITGHDYQVLEHGPAPRKLVPVREELEAEGRAVLHAVKYFNRDQKRLFALDDPNMEVFSASEVNFVKSLIERNWDKNAKDVSTLSHKFIGWQLANEGEVIPYAVSLVVPGTPTLEQRRKAAGIASAILAGNAG